LTLFDPDVAGEQPATTKQTPGADVGSGSGTAGNATLRLRLTVAYDGVSFRGFAAQPGQRTVGGELASAIETVVGHAVEIGCAGRTDAGVHASSQVVHVDVRADIAIERLVRSLNAMLAPTVVVLSAAEVPSDFDARRSARARRYRYLVLESATAHPLLAPVAWQVPGPLDVRAMQSGADALLGEHDFRAFCRRRPGSAPDTPILRRVLDARLREVAVPSDALAPGARLLRFDVEATSFCHQMVRSMVGVLVEIGRGRRRVADVTSMLRSGNRSRNGGVIAPPHGLCLTGVDY
jgi:tRNA pseudouridine38-40 synthase